MANYRVFSMTICRYSHVQTCVFLPFYVKIMITNNGLKHSTFIQYFITLLTAYTFLVNVSLKFGTVYRQALLVLSHYCRVEILSVMSTSVYIPNTDRCFLICFYYQCI